jgi:hypothetical protein
VLSTSVDLTDQDQLVVDLLNGHQQWRERIVQELEFGAGGEVRVVSSYQVRFPAALVAAYTKPEHELARMVLPLGTRAKASLLNVGFSGAGGSPVQLLPRETIAVHQADFLLALLAACPNAGPIAAGLPRPLLEAICRFTPHRYQEVRRDLNRRFGPRRDMEALAKYLADGVGLAQQPAPGTVRRWLRRLEPTSAALLGALGERAQADSSAENVLLALPELRRHFVGEDEVEAVLEAYCAAIESATDVNDKPFLGALAEYGRRYEVLVEVDAPLQKSFSVQMSEDRPLNLRRGGRSPQLFASGDARSAHLEARAIDHSVAFSGAPTVTDLRGAPVAGLMDGLRATDETVSLYSSDEARPYYVEVAFRLRNAATARWTTLLLMALNVSAGVAVLVAPHDSLYIERLSLLLVPTTLAAALVLARDQTALAARLQRRPKMWLAFTIVALWAVMLIEVIGFKAPTP